MYNDVIVDITRSHPQELDCNDDSQLLVAQGMFTVVEVDRDTKLKEQEQGEGNRVNRVFHSDIVGCPLVVVQGAVDGKHDPVH